MTHAIVCPGQAPRHYPLREIHRLQERHARLALHPILTNYNAVLDTAISEAIADAERDSQRMGRATLPLYDVLRYHLGFKDQHFNDARSDAGKRIRPLLCLLSCAASGGDVEQAVPTAAAIELLHNFTLIHDDIQDRSDLRRHRPTIWSIWDTAQAINAGDAMFAVSHLSLARSATYGVETETILALSSALHRTTLRIVEGQVMDLGFEERIDVTVDEYMEMVGGKSASITRCACWAGATIAGERGAAADRLGDIGFALGIGFQLRDDVLGTWGETSDTGKPAADDIYKRKKSLPILLLMQNADEGDRTRVESMYASRSMSDGEVMEILGLLTRYEVRPLIEDRVRHWHDQSQQMLESVLAPSEARDELGRLVETLAVRTR